MKAVKFLFLILIVFLVLQSASCIIFGAGQPETTCIKPNRTGFMEVLCNSGESEYAYFQAELSGPDFMMLKENIYLFLPHSRQSIPIFLNTTDVEEGYYEGNFTFCPASAATEAGVNFAFCVSPNIFVNVSENCAELPALATKNSTVSAEQEKFLGLMEYKTFKTVFNITALFLVIMLLIVFTIKNFHKKRHKI